MEPERRFLATEAPTATGRTISGYASRFNSRSENLGTPDRAFHEIIPQPSHRKA
jgi:phage head maturation protease